MQRLEELMQWQRQQQEKLVRHQQEQKALITFEQKRLFKEIGALLEQGKYLQEGNKIDVAPVPEVKTSLPNQNIDEQDKVDAESPQMKHLVVDSFDEMPVKQVTKSFNQLLQEKLKTDENKNSLKNTEKPKKKFLKKGEGLARFRMSGHQPLSKPLSKKVNEKKNSDTSPKKSSTSLSAKTHSDYRNLSRIENNQEKVIKGAFLPSATTKRSKDSYLVLDSPKRPPTSLDNSMREQDELNLFEFLEQQAENSSFCSTSSVVARLLGEPLVKSKLTSDFNKQPLQDATHLNILQRTMNDSAKINMKYRARNSNDYHNTLANINEPTIRMGYCKTNSLLNLAHESNIMSYSETSPQIESQESESKELIFDIKQSSCQESIPKHVSKLDNLHVIKNKAEICSTNSKITEQTHSDVSESTTLKECTSISPDSYHQTKGSPETEADTFKDSQAWSDCSCTSCEGTDSENETPPPDAVMQQPVLEEASVGDNESNKNKEVLISDVEQAITFKSTLLKERLTELENEIDIFKKENANLKKLRRQYENDIVNFNKEKKEYEKVLKENSEKMQESILAERRKLARERQVFERYCKGIKNQPTRQEREEIQALKQQVAELQEELIRKDARWSATQVRTRDRLRQLNQQLSMLKEENEKLKNEKEKIKKVRFFNPKVRMGSNTRVLHSVNEKLGQFKIGDLENPIIIKNVVPRKRIPAHVLSQGMTSIKTKNFEKCNKITPVLPDLESKATNTSEGESDPSNFLGIANDYEDGVEIQLQNFDEDCGADDTETLNQNKSLIQNGNELLMNVMYNSFYPDGREVNGKLSEQAKDMVRQNASLEEHIAHSDCSQEMGLIKDGTLVTQELADTVLKSLKNCNTVEHNDVNRQQINTISSVNTELSTSPERQVVMTQLPILQKTGIPLKEFSETIHPDGTREKNFSDGRQEVWYPNGNVKKISSDKSISKMIYYNGDVKEKYHMDGLEKYYYAETKTWQTSYSDGREIVEFPNGQVESKRSDGSSEISYPNGCTLIKHVDGSEEWTLTDGTIVKTYPSGIKELLFPNGQKEIHTENHKRREYPDGTVKFIYPDGTQETRYATGRIRRKDKDGNLVLDATIQ